MGRPKKVVAQAAKEPEIVPEGMFTAEELAELEASAMAEFDAEQKKQHAEAFKEETKRRLKQKQLFAAGKNAEGKDTESVLIDLAPHSPFINIDGRLFFNAMTYKLTQAQAQTVKDMMHRTWMHEREIGGANINAMSGRQPFHKTIGPDTHI